MNHEVSFAEQTNQNLITAIDIGTTKIVAIVGRKEHSGKIRILGTGSVPTPEDSVKRGSVSNIEDVSKAIKQAVEKAEKKSGIKFTSAFVGIAGQHIKSQRNSHSKLITSKDHEIFASDIDSLIADMHRISLEPGQEIIHVIPQNYVVDNEIGVMKPVGMFGKKIVGNFHIVIGEVTSAKNIERCVNRADIQVSGLILEPLASSSAVLTKDEKEAGVALVDIGGGTTDIALYHEGILQHTAVLPFGGNVVTSDIKTGCSILQRHAEELKLKFGDSLAEFAPKNHLAVIPGISGREPKEIQVKTLAEIIQARMEEIIDQIMFELENSGYAQKLGAGIALTGGGSLLKNLPALMKFRTGLDVRTASPINYLAADTLEEVKSPKYSTAVGLLLEGSRMAEKNPTKIQPQINLEAAPNKSIPTVTEERAEENTVNKNEPKKSNSSSGKGKFGEFIETLFGDKDTELS
jgi:cell division protein FtsA